MRQETPEDLLQEAAVMRTCRTAWTLQELVVCIALLAVVLAMLFPVILWARESANQAVCRNNLRQLGLAVQSYNEALGTLPPYSTGQPGTKVLGGWWLHLAP